MNYYSITFYERMEIERLLICGYSIRQIAYELFRSPSTISREIKLNRVNKRCYDAQFADHKAEERRKKKRVKSKTENPTLISQVKKYLTLGLSHEPNPIYDWVSP